MKHLALFALCLTLTACATYNNREIKDELSDHFEIVEQGGDIILFLPWLIFEFDSHELSDIGKERLAILGKFLNQSRSDNLYLYIKGHTDDQGDEEWNYDLGLRRAETVRQVLSESDIDADRMDIASGGETSPRVPNTSQENRQTNRRVEVVIINP